MSQLFGTKLHNTTAYHPQANGIVERMHRHLEASLKARCKGPNWMDELPWVMLGFRTCPKVDLGTSSAEQVYSSPLKVPGDFVCHTKETSDPKKHLEELRERIYSLVPVPSSRHRTVPVHLPKVLAYAQYVFVRRE
ncbi:hypothetical protein ACOME3_004474 [Neoechinorhynchus agilis]